MSSQRAIPRLFSSLLFDRKSGESTGLSKQNFSYGFRRGKRASELIMRRSPEGNFPIKVSVTKYCSAWHNSIKFQFTEYAAQKKSLRAVTNFTHLRAHRERSCIIFDRLQHFWQEN